MAEEEKKYTQADLDKAKQEGADNAKAAYKDELEKAKKEVVQGKEKEILDSVKKAIGFDYEVENVDQFKEAWDKYIEAQGDVDDVKETPEYKSIHAKLQDALKEKQALESEVESITSEYESKLQAKDVNSALAKSFSDIQEDVALNAEDAIDLFQSKSGYSVEIGDNGEIKVLDENGIEEIGGDGEPKKLGVAMKDWLFKRGYSKVDGAAGGETKPGSQGGNVITRTAFDKLGSAEQHKAINDGVKVVD